MKQLSRASGGGTSIGSPARAKTILQSSQENEELNFSHSEFLTELDDTDNLQRSEPNPHPKSSYGETVPLKLTQEQLDQLALERRQKEVLEQQLKEL